MKVDNISFGKWYRVSYYQLKRLSSEEALRLGMEVEKCKTKQSIYHGLDGLYIDVSAKKERNFLNVCDYNNIMPDRAEISTSHTNTGKRW